MLLFLNYDMAADHLPYLLYFKRTTDTKYNLKYEFESVPSLLLECDICTDYFVYNS